MPELKTIPTKSIKVRERQRKDYGDLTGLAASIKKYGQMQTIYVEPMDDQGDYYLIAGGRRLAGLIVAEKPEALVRVHDGEMDDLLRQELELEENIQRKDLSWAEREAAVATIHKIKKESAAREGKDWTADDTANLLGVSRRKIYNAIEITEAIEKDPEVARADTAHGAMQRLQRLKDLEKRKEEVQVRQLAQTQGTGPKLDVKVLVGDALQHMKSLPDASQDFVITNPPFGVDIESVFTSDKKIYEDDPDDVSSLCQGIIRESYRVLKDNRWLVIFYPTLKLEECRQFLAEAGFKFQRVPAIWYKPNKSVGAISDYYQQLVINYESFFFARKGDARFHEKPRPGNVFVYDTPPANRHHPLQMPPDLWEEILRLITIGGESGVEPFAGSGSGGVASIRRQVNYTGFELDPQFADRANVWIQETLLGKAEPDAPAVKNPMFNFDEVPFE